MRTILRHPRRLLVRLVVLALCAPLGLAVAQDGRRLVEDGVFGADLSGVVPANLEQDLDRARAEAGRMSTNPKVLAAVVCIPDRFTPPDVMEPPDDKLLLALKPRAADLEDLKRLCCKYSDLQTASAQQLMKWENPFPDHAFSKLMEDFLKVARQQVKIRDLATESGAAAFKKWESAVKDYCSLPYYNQAFYQVQLGLIHEQHFQTARRPEELFGKRLRAALGEGKVGLAEVRKELDEGVKTLKSHLGKLGDCGKGEKQADGLREVWQARLDRWQKGVKLLDLSVEADRVLDKKDHKAVKAMIDELAELTGDKKFATLKSEVVKVAQKFLDLYLPRELPLDADVKVKITDSGYETVQRAEIKIAWNDNTSTDLKTVANQKKFDEFNINSWKGRARRLIVGGSTRDVDLQPTKIGKRRNEYTAQRTVAGWRWNSKCVRALAKAFASAEAEALLGADCVQRLKLLAEVMPDCFQ